ncbi:MAG: hypothetical protein ACO33A_04040 [Hyphomonas sp.]
MKKTIKLTFLMASGILGACASVDAQDRFLLGDANRSNVAQQASRDVSLPNSETVDTLSGVRAVNAIKALNEGEARQPPGTSTGGGE